MLLTYNNPEQIPELEYTEARRLHFFERGENIPIVNNGLWQVYRGLIFLSKNHNNGEEVLLGWAKSSAFFGHWFNQTHQGYQAKALSDVYLKWYSLLEIQSSAYMINALLEQMISRMEQTETLLAIANLRRVEMRLKELLILLKQHLSEPTILGNRLEVRLTHQHLASAIGTTRVTVTRLLKEFQRQGLITIDKNRHIVILDGLTNN